MIDRQGAKVLIECDSCDEVFSGEDHEEFTDVWSRAKREGWTTRKYQANRSNPKGEWTHGCPTCEA